MRVGIALDLTSVVAGFEQIRVGPGCGTGRLGERISDARMLVHVRNQTAMLPVSGPAVRR